MTTYELLNCPYCPKRTYTSRRPNNLGKYKIYVTSTNWLIFKCSRCRDVFKARYVGTMLTKQDMEKKEKELRGKEDGTRL